MTEKGKRRLILLFTADFIFFAVCLNLFALFHHVLPREAGVFYGVTQTLDQAEDWSEKFPDRFAPEGEIIRGDGFYMDSQLNLTVKTYTENGVTYHVADFYIRNITVLRTAMAGGTFATGVADSTLKMARENGAVLAVSGDYFGIRERGMVIRNGKVYRKTKAHEVCVLYRNGTMETYPFSSFDAERAIAGGAWQAWDFGPALLDENGSSVTEFQTGISGKNPRIGIGYFEPGHYCLVAIDGRQSSSRGMTLLEMAKLFENLGCQRAYNLDGGHSAVMTFDDEIWSSPSKENGRDISDIVYLAPAVQKETP